MLGIIVDKKFHDERKWVVYSTFNLIQGLLKTYNSVIISSQQEYEKVKDQLTACYCTFPGWSSPFIKHDISLPYTKGFVLSDPHHEEAQKWVPDYIHDNKIDYVLAYYYYPTIYHYPHLKEKIVHLPWTIPDEFASPKINSYGHKNLQVFGSVNHDAYSCRRWLHKFPFVAVDNNSGCENPKLDEVNYYKWLNNFDAIIAAGSLHNKYQLVTPKYFEIANSGALLFAQFCRDLTLNGFNNNNCIIFDTDNFVEQANEYLKNSNKYFYLKVNSQKLIQERHLTSIRVNQIGETLELERKNYTIKNFAGIEGTTIKINLNSSKYLDNEIITQSLTEKPLTDFFKRYINKSMNCIDVGANIGYYSILFSILANKVIAFEPTSKYHRILKINLKLNNIENVSVIRKGLSDKHIENTIITIGECSATLHFPENAKIFGQENIELTSLDNIIKSKVDLIKIDVDGHDFNVIKGASRIINLYRPLIAFEVAAPQYYSNGINLPEVYKFFENINYSVYCETQPYKKINIDEFIKIADVTDRSWNFI
jgi:FkbM family methyltransferase